MKKLILLLLIWNVLFCSAQSIVRRIDFDFKPSFHYSTKFMIDVKNKTIEQVIYKDNHRVKEWIDSNSYEVNVIDTLIVFYQKSVEISDHVLEKFLIEFNSCHLDSTVVNGEPILDGIRYKISKIGKDSDTIWLKSNLTRRKENSILNYKILDAFFRLAHESILDEYGIYGIEAIQDYFDFGLPIRKVEENPNEYRVWGTIAGCRDDNQEFLAFLEGLPSHKPVIFDLSGGRIADCLKEVIEEYSLKKELYFYGEINGKYSTRDEVLKTIANKK